MILKNWIDFIRKHTSIFIILLVSQILALLCIFFVFGVFQNNLYEINDYDDTRSLNTSIKKADITSKQLDEFFRAMVNDSDNVDYFYVTAQSKSGKYSYIDHAQLKNGKYGFSDTVYSYMKYGIDGFYYTNEDYVNKNKVLVSTEDRLKKYGDEVKLEGDTYKIVATNSFCGDIDTFYVPYTSFPKKCVWQNLSFGLTSLPTRKQYELFRSYVKKLGGEPDDFYVANNQDLKQKYSMLVVSAILAFLAACNMYMIYSYIFRKRRKNLGVFLLCGCSKKRARMMYFMEILCNMICVVVVSIGIFRFLLYPQMLSWFRYVDRVYGVGEYGCIIGIFLMITFIFGYLLSCSVTRKSILQFRRGEA